MSLSESEIVLVNLGDHRLELVVEFCDLRSHRLHCIGEVNVAHNGHDWFYRLVLSTILTSSFLPCKIQ